MNFPLILTILTVVTFICWIADKKVFSKNRRAAADRALAQFRAANAEAIDRHDTRVIDEMPALKMNTLSSQCGSNTPLDFSR